MPPKVSNRVGTFVGIKGVTRVVEIPLAPFVSNRNAGRATDFEDFKEPSVREAMRTEAAISRKRARKIVMGAGEEP
jgi:hypothetical protein